MNRCLKYVVMAMLVVFTGCGADQSLVQTLATNWVETQCRSAAAIAVVPDGVPADLAVVQADPARFGPESNPLAGVVVGTKLDDLSGLAGCWGRYTRQTIENSQTGQSAVSEEFAVLKFDLDRGTVTLQRYLAMPSTDVDGSIARAGQFLGDAVSFDLPIFLTEVYSITGTADNLLLLQGVSAQGAAVGADGRPVFSCLASLSADINSAATLQMLLTRQGDFLKEYDSDAAFDSATSAEDIAPAEADEFADLWARFDCSAN